MTQFPTLIDQIAAAVLVRSSVDENPYHRAILDVYIEVQDLDRKLAAMAGDERLDGVSVTEQLDQLTELLIDRMAAGAELSAWLSMSCRCAAALESEDETEYELALEEEPDFEPDFEPEYEPDFEPEYEPDFEPDFDPDFDDFEAPVPEEDVASCQDLSESIVHACLQVFGALADPAYVATADLVAHLRDLPGEGEGQRPYADITPIRLARLLAPMASGPASPAPLTAAAPGAITAATCSPLVPPDPADASLPCADTTGDGGGPGADRRLSPAVPGGEPDASLGPYPCGAR
ncbi:DUF3631 domain-containing protein [Streptomyces sp. NPDC052101]|uniref:DUF3631 domain-containing protein n=1 Tax=Streptomyces sp. NPDC052101 TaxID=3155763 RepID=UPI00341FF4CC